MGTRPKFGSPPTSQAKERSLFSCGAKGAIALFQTCPHCVQRCSFPSATFRSVK
ncbi:hypothetical protein PN499_13390 [Kamptonema animale CS-326]|nr:hypothetical protein [Kamptonema animale CS-326]